MSDRRTPTVTHVAGLLVFISVPLLAQQTRPPPPPGPGLELLERSCVNCHDLNTITLKRRTPEEWAAVVGLMADRGAEVTPQEIQIITEYLAQNFSNAGSGSASAR